MIQCLLLGASEVCGDDDIEAPQVSADGNNEEVESEIKHKCKGKHIYE